MIMTKTSILFYQYFFNASMYCSISDLAPAGGGGAPSEEGVPVDPRRTPARDTFTDPPPVPAPGLKIITSVMMSTTEATTIPAMILESINIYYLFF
jgi:hypothetical protein